MFDEISEKILAAQNECTLSWITQDGSPAATVVSFLYAEDCIWMTALAGSARIRAISRDGRVAVTISGKGSKAGDTRCVSMRGSCEILADAKTRDWFFPLFSRRVLHKSRVGASMMAKSMNTADNLVLKFHSEKVIPYDAQRMMKMANFMP
ncbi:MAG: pyridoxamine 5'-phosphate oxidase family protein [Pseudomonadales bacterium]|nr:pyridoxamine 5'-phosphate oxidase family protein [Pseudomonadales bacterium]